MQILRRFTRIQIICTAAGAAVVLALAGCGEKATEPPRDPWLTGRVYDASDSGGVTAANVVVYDANENAPITRGFTDADGRYSFALTPGAYYIRIEAQHYISSPPPGGQPVSFQAEGTDTTFRDIYLDTDPDAGNTGSISGTIKTADGEGLGGVLVAAETISGGNTLSGTSGPDGFFILYNTLPGTYQVRAYIEGYAQDNTALTANVRADSMSAGLNMTLNAGAPGRVTGQISFVATQNPDSNIDVTLIHPEVRQAVPGLIDFTGKTVSAYAISAIPIGTYIVWASYRNDGYVMDPDAIFKWGLPTARITAGTPDTSISFKVTGAIKIDFPTNPPASLHPVPITSTAPEFRWTKTSAYSEAKEFIVEVFNGRGESIWGGYDENGTVRHPQIGSKQTSAVFNYDGSASGALEEGGIYRWKVYADDDDALNVQTLVSSSEDLMGLFQVVPDTSLIN